MPPSSPGSAPDFASFLDSFLQESNIKWLLACGAAILLASSLMLVVNQWGEYTAAWKYLIMMLYTAAIYRAGLWASQALLLRKTGIALLALTVFLLPTLFAVLYRIGIDSQILCFALFGLTLIFAWAAADQTFCHLLRRRQITFLLSYLLLSAAFFILPSADLGSFPGHVLLLWLIVCIGIVKVNRHVFWLGEQQQLPRIFGFFPVLLLGAIFVAYFALNIASEISAEWYGVVLVMLAVPVMMSADAAASVFDQRTGSVFLRRPAAIALPVVSSMLLALLGPLVSFLGLLPGHTPLAVTPTAVFAALVFFCAAHRMQIQSLTWPVLILATLAYNFSPFFFRDLALQTIASGAVLVREEKLPLAFYGLTYLPLIVVISVVAYILRNKSSRVRSETPVLSIWQKPCEIFAGLLACILLFVSFGDTKAAFLVSAVLLPILVAQAILFRSSWLVFPALIAFVAAAASAGEFLQNMYVLTGLVTESWVWISVAALLLLLGGRYVSPNRSSKTIAGVNIHFAGPMRFTSLLLTLYLVVAYFAEMPGLNNASIAWITVFALLLWAHAARLQSALIAFLAAVAFYFLLTMLWIKAYGLSGIMYLPALWTVLGGFALLFLSRFAIVPQNLTRGFRRVATIILFTCAGLALCTNLREIVFAGFASTVFLLLSAYQRRAARLTLLAAVVLNWLLFSLLLTLTMPNNMAGFALFLTYRAQELLPFAGLLAVISIIFWSRPQNRARLLASEFAFATEASRLPGQTIARLHILALGLFAAGTLLLSFQLNALTIWQGLAALLSFALPCIKLFRSACERNSERLVWAALLSVCLAIFYFAVHGWLQFGGGWSPLILVCTAVVAWFLSEFAHAQPTISICAKPFRNLSRALVLVAVSLIFCRVLLGYQANWPGLNSIALLIAAGFHLLSARTEQRTLRFTVSALLANAGLMLLWLELGWSDPQLYLVPFGVSVLLLRSVLHHHLPENFHAPLNYAGALIILTSPLFNIAQGSWLHIFTLMLCSVAVLLCGIGFRFRALLYSGTAFLIIALISMLVRGTIDHPGLLWISGLFLGAGVLFVGALAERNRELLVQRVRLMTSELGHWN